MVDMLTRAETLSKNGDPNSDFKVLEVDHLPERKKEEVTQTNKNTIKFKNKSIPHKAKLISL